MRRALPYDPTRGLAAGRRLTGGNQPQLFRLGQVLSRQLQNGVAV
jgi:hypothetical protein